MRRLIHSMAIFFLLGNLFLTACTTTAKVADSSTSPASIPPAKNALNRPSRESLENAIRQNSGTRVELTNPIPMEEQGKRP